MLEMYGVPRLGDYYKDDIQRSFIKLPLNQSISEVQEFSKMIKDLDNQLSSDAFKEKIFGSKSKKYTYQSIFRLPNEEDEDIVKPNSIPRIPYMKLKLNTTYPTNEIITTVFLKDKLKNEYKIVEDIANVDNFCKYVCYQSKLKAIIAPVKLWAQASTIKDPMYGITFKILKVQVEQPVNTSISTKDYLNNMDGFLNSDSEEEEEKNTSSNKNDICKKEIQSTSSSSHDKKTFDTKDTIKEEEEEEEDEEEISDSD